MNVESYIESGVLEAYVGGFLSDAENKEVDQMAEKYPEIKEEIEKIQKAVRIYAQQNESAVQPPSLDSIIMNLAEEGEEQAAEEKIKSPNWMPYALAAAITLFLLSSFFAFNLYQDMQALRSEVASLSDRTENLEQEKNYISEQYAALRQNPIVIEQHQKIINDPASIPIIMTGLESAPDSKVHVFWHSTSKDVYLLIDELPEPPKDHQYQLWAIIDGVSLDAGIFDHHSKMQKLRHVEGKVSAFAVTLEEAGGSPTPRLDRMYVKGELKEA
ncbi:MAG: anti-sigma factor [Bacteroidia bacterium]|nr:anti-sigma factor [Bacteroidia bacterium]